jgi:hypothetical protein
MLLPGFEDATGPDDVDDDEDELPHAPARAAIARIAVSAPSNRTRGRMDVPPWTGE